LLIINNISYQPEELKEQSHKLSASKELSTWEKSIFQFVNDWLNDSELIYQQTSGSTGNPKTIKLRKSWMEYSARQTCQYFHLNESHTALLCLPINYIAGKMMIVRSLICGFDLICVEPTGNPFKDLNPPIDFAAITPFQLFQSLDTLKTAPVKTVIVGGGEISDALEKEVKDLPVKVFATYGMTETSSHVAIRPVNGPHAENFFTILGSTKMETDQRNCLVLENPYLFEERLITNDIIEMYSDKSFAWLGRYDNIINSGGIKIIPEELETKLSPLFHEPILLSWLPDSRLGQSLVLVIEAKEENANLKGEILDKVRKVLPSNLIPQNVIFVSEIPKTTNGKPDRESLRKHLLKALK
jgi:O-succinylbenzoic acid--CoA ligase